MFTALKQHPLFQLWLKRKDWRRRSVVGAVFSSLNKLFDIAPEILIGLAVDTVVNRESSFLADILHTSDLFSQILALGALTFLIWGLESVFEYLQKITWRRLAQNVQHALRIEAFSQTIHYALSWFEKETTGNYVTTLNEDIHQLERFLDGGINTIIQLICSTVFVSLVFFYVSPLLGILSLIPIPLLFVWSSLFHKKLRTLYSFARKASEDVAVRLSGVFSGIVVIKSFNQEDNETKTLTSLSNAYVEANQKAILLSSAFTPTVRVFILLGFLSTLMVGGYLCLSGKIGVPAYSIVVFLTQRLLWPFTTLAETIDQYQRAMASSHRVMTFLSQKTQNLEAAQLATPSPITSPITSTITSTPPSALTCQSLHFKDVHFSYPASEKPTLINVNIAAKKGEVIGICGPTGSGKSTLAKLLLQFYPPASGGIYFDDHLTGTSLPQAMRHSIAFVSQDTFLFDDTIGHNLLYGNPDATTSQLQEVMDLCKLSPWIATLQEGLNTVIGERGVKISGGQRQRISLARALLKKAPILVLDEATSAIDNDTEKDINEVIYGQASDKITLVIAHRLSTIRAAHRIYVLVEGKVTETGTHQDLCNKPQGTYHNLWKLQTGES
ncbi:MAG: ABC transporter ATP-binding protein [Proteobacteria bacterium]|nr:ABC transporter ATP-binding protein [Pseudomonadota bacterium]